MDFLVIAGGVYLADHLKKHGIDYIPYKDFFDIIEKFGSYLK